jgi:hypothetical protein
MQYLMQVQEEALIDIGTYICSVQGDQIGLAVANRAIVYIGWFF